MRFAPADLIRIKRDGAALSPGQIVDLVDGVVDGSLTDAQLGAFLMAVRLRGMDVNEMRCLTLAMRDSGDVMDLSAVPGRKVDKHSTGGVGDKVSLLLAPWVAAAGVPVPMVSGRGLGHTGGTLDKLEAIPGFTTQLSADDYRRVLQSCGFVMAGAGPGLAPADRRMYATRDVTATVDSIPLITASILSKKLAEGIDGLVLDVKVGRAAFMPERPDAERLMSSLVETCAAAGVDVVALLTDMDSPLGLAIGNALEVREVIDALRGEGPADLMEVTRALAAEMLVLGGVATDPTDAERRLQHHLDNGDALARAAANVELQGGDPRVFDDPDRLPTAPHVEVIHADRAGFVTDIDPLALGLIAVELGAGRRRSEDDVDPAVGIKLAVCRGENVAAGAELCRIHAASEAEAATVRDRVRGALQIGEDRAPGEARVLGRLEARA